jgi:hypothetical protein
MSSFFLNSLIFVNNAIRYPCENSDPGASSQFTDSSPEICPQIGNYGLLPAAQSNQALRALLKSNDNGQYVYHLVGSQVVG